MLLISELHLGISESKDSGNHRVRGERNPTCLMFSKKEHLYPLICKDCILKGISPSCVTFRLEEYCKIT